MSGPQPDSLLALAAKALEQTADRLRRTAETRTFGPRTDAVVEWAAARRLGWRPKLGQLVWVDFGGEWRPGVVDSGPEGVWVRVPNYDGDRRDDLRARDDAAFVVGSTAYGTDELVIPCDATTTSGPVLELLEARNTIERALLMLERAMRALPAEPLYRSAGAADG